MKQHESGGKLLFWPNIDFYYEGSIYEKEGENYWSEGAMNIGKAFIATLTALHKSSKIMQESPPEWVLVDKYMTESEKKSLQRYEITKKDAGN